MTEAVQWSPGDVDAWTRAFAEDHAQRAGLSVRDWLEQFVARETALAGPEAQGNELSETAWPAEHDVSPQSGDAPWRDTDELESDDPVTAWAPPRDAFGQRTGSPEPRSYAESAPASSVAPSEAVTDAASGFGDAEDDSIEAHFSARARVAGLWDLAEPPQQLDGGDGELLLGGPAPTAEPPAAPRLDEVEIALRQVREAVQAAAPHAGARAASRPSPAAASDSAAPEPGQASADAIAQLGIDIARLVEVVDCGFERLEAVGAKQAIDLRSDVAQMLDELAARLGHGDPTIAAKPDAEPPAAVALEAPEAEPPPAAAWDEPDTEPAPATASDDLEAAPPTAVGTDDPEAAPAPVVASDDAEPAPSPVVDAVDPEAEHAPVAASDDTEVAPPRLLASDDADTEPMPAVASDGADAAPDDAHADPRPAAGWDDDDLFDDPADLISTAPPPPFGRALARDDTAPAVTTVAGSESEAGWADRGDWSEASAADFERHMDISAAPPADDSVRDETDLSDHPAEAEPAPAANPDKGFSWLRFPGSKLLRKRVA